MNFKLISFEELTIIVLASNEQKSLRETINLLCKLCSPDDIAEIIVFLKSEDCPAKKEYDKIVSEGFVPFEMRGCIQTIPGFVEVFYEAPRLVRSSHFLCIGADLEMDPGSVPKMIEISKKNPEAIVCASKFAKGSVREGYGFFHMLSSRFLNLIVRKIIGSTGTELISTFEIHPTKIHRDMNFTNESVSCYGFCLKPVLYGTQYIEIPTKYVGRNEAKSNINLLSYMKIGSLFLNSAIKLRLEYNKIKRKNKK